MKLLLIALVLSAAVVLPAMMTLPTADACQPLSFRCPITGQYVHTCSGTVSVPPIVYCVPGILDQVVPTLP